MIEVNTAWSPCLSCPKGYDEWTNQLLVILFARWSNPLGKVIFRDKKYYKNKKKWKWDVSPNWFSQNVSLFGWMVARSNRIKKSLAYEMQYRIMSRMKISDGENAAMLAPNSSGLKSHGQSSSVTALALSRNDQGDLFISCIGRKAFNIVIGGSEKLGCSESEPRRMHIYFVDDAIPWN